MLPKGIKKKKKEWSSILTKVCRNGKDGRKCNQTVRLNGVQLEVAPNSWVSLQRESVTEEAPNARLNG
jgi:hypothetical protein